MSTRREFLAATAGIVGALALSPTLVSALTRQIGHWPLTVGDRITVHVTYPEYDGEMTVTGVDHDLATNIQRISCADHHGYSMVFTWDGKFNARP